MKKHPATRDAPAGTPTLLKKSILQYNQGDLFLSLFGRTICASWLILIAATLLVIPLISPLFDPGPPINSDIGVHYSNFVCYAKSTMWSMPTNWCAHGQAGLARYQRHGVIHGYIAYIFSLFLPLEVAFKAMLVTVYFILALAGYFFLAWLGYPLAGAIAYTLFLHEPGGYYWGGYHLHFIITGIVNYTGTAFSLVTVFALVWMLTQPSPWRIAVASFANALHFLSHPGSALWLPIAAVPALLLYRKNVLSHWKILLVYPLLFFLFTSFWFAPAISKSSYFNPPGLGGIGYFSPTSFILGFPTSQFLLLFFAVISACYLLLFRKEPAIKLIAIVVFSIPLVWWLSSFNTHFWYFHYFTLDRSLYELRTFLILSASLVLGGCYQPQHAQPPSTTTSGIRATLQKTFFFASLLFLVVLLIFFFRTTLNSSQYIFTGKDAEPYLLPIYQFVSRAEGRIVAENFYQQAGKHPLSYSQTWALSGAYSDREFLGNSDFWYTLPDYSVAYQGTFLVKPLDQIPKDQLVLFLWMLNVQYVWTVSSFQEPFSHLLPKAPNYLWPLGTLYETPWEHSYFFYNKGTLINTSYTTLHASAFASSPTGGTLLFKVREWPNWHAWIDGKRAPITRNPLGLMHVEIPPGDHLVQFEYTMIAIDWAGYLLTLIGFVLAAGWILADHWLRKPTQRAHETPNE